MNLTIKPSPELTELSKITGLTENELSNKIIHILDVELHCIEHWTTDAGRFLYEIFNSTIMGYAEYHNGFIVITNKVGIKNTLRNRKRIIDLQLWGNGEHPCPDCGCETEIDHTEDIKFCVNPDCDFKETTDHTDYDFKRKFNKENN